MAVVSIAYALLMIMTDVDSAGLTRSIVLMIQSKPISIERALLSLLIIGTDNC